MGHFLIIARRLNWPRIASVAVILILAVAFWGSIFEHAPAIARRVLGH